MADTQSVVSDVKLFLDRLRKELPEIFSGKNSAQADAAPASQENVILFEGSLCPAQMYITPDQEEGAVFDGKSFHIYMHSRQSDAATLATRYLRQKANDLLRTKTNDWAEKMDVEYNHIAIKDQQTLWASCSGKKNINYSYRLVKMPLAVQDYLVVHELAHLVHMNHGQEYWQLVAQYCPDYQLHRRWLNENKGSLFAEIALTYQEPPGEEIPPSTPEDVPVAEGIPVAEGLAVTAHTPKENPLPSAPADTEEPKA